MVALVVRGHRHNRTGAITRQDIVGHPDWDGLAVGGVDRISAGEDATLLTHIGNPLAL